MEAYSIKTKAQRDFQEFVERTANYDLLKKAREAQLKAIEVSRIKPPQTFL